MTTNRPIVFWTDLITHKQSIPCCGGLRVPMPSETDVSIITTGNQHKDRVLLETIAKEGMLYAWADRDEVST